MYKIAAVAESASEHPLAGAIMRKAEQLGISHFQNPVNFKVNHFPPFQLTFSHLCFAEYSWQGRLLSGRWPRCLRWKSDLDGRKSHQIET